MRVPKIIKDPRSLIDLLAQAIANYTYEHGIKQVLLTPLTICTVLVAVGVVPATASSARATIIVICWIISIALIAALLLERQSRNLEDYQKSKVLNMYTDRLLARQRESPGYFKYLELDEYIVVSADHSVEIHRYCTIEATADAIPAIWSLVSKAGLTDEGRSKAVPKFSCRTFRGDPAKTYPTGVITPQERIHGGSMVHTFHKLSDNSYVGYAHLDTPANKGEIVHVYFKWTWDNFCEELFDTGREVMYWRIHQYVESFRARMRFEKGCGTSTFSTSPHGGTSATIIRMPDEAIEYVLEIDQPTPSHRFGFVVDTGR